MSKRKQYVSTDIVKRPQTFRPTQEQMREYIRELNEQIDERKQSVMFRYAYYGDNTVTQKIHVCMTHMDRLELTGYHDHDYYEFNIILEGEILEYVSEQFLTLTPGKLLLMPPGVKHALFTSENCTAYNILVKKEFFDNYSFSITDTLGISTLHDTIRNGRAVVFEYPLGSDVDQVLMKLVKWHKSENKVTPMFFEAGFSELYLLLLGLLDTATVLGETNKFRSGEGIVNYIIENYDTVSMKEVCERFDYSPAQIHRIVIRTTGQNMQTLINHKRLLTAKNLLTQTSIPVARIATMLGLDSSKYFSRLYKKQTGFSPLSYRKAFKNGTLPDYVFPEDANDFFKEHTDKKD